MGNGAADAESESTWEPLPDCHACLIFDSEAQREAIVPRYLADGFRRGEFVRYFADVTSSDVVLSWAQKAGVPETATGESGPLRIVAAEGAYCPDGRFDPRRIIDGMVPAYEGLRRTGFHGVRTCAEMSWALRGLPGSERLMEYEALLNTLPDAFPHGGMCQYDARRFDGATLFQVLQVHPNLVAGGRIVRNPDYVKPEDFLAGIHRAS